MIKLMKTCCIAFAILLTAVSVTAAAGENGGCSEVTAIDAEMIGNLRNIDFTALENDGEAKAFEKGKHFTTGKDNSNGETGYVIIIDGEEVLYVRNEADAAAVVEGLVNAYRTPGSELVNYAFAEEILYEERDVITADEALKDETVMETYICNVDEAVGYILNGTSTPLTYTVKGGDTLWDIALAHDISVYELEAMNPGASQKLSIGQQINLYQKNPFVTVTLTEVVTADQSIPYEIAYEYTDKLYKGQVQVKSVGQTGSKHVTAEITRQNGVEIANNVLEETIISEPVTQIALAGTSSIAIQSGTGQLQLPLAYIEVSSPYGSRGGSFHRAVDLRAPKGTSIMAADDGTVISAGWSGTYGLLIVLDHGNGMVTKYAHCDTIGVTLGQNVQKGEVIGTVGITGNATGYHLHFEVVVNGATKNPMNYL